MQVRRLEAGEHGNTRPLYEEVFEEDSKSFVDYYYAEKTKDNIIYVAEEDGEIRSMLHLNPYQLMVNGEIKNAHYIVAVATQKEYRKRGFMAALMKRALKDMYRDNEAFTFLMPASESIYLPHDFRTVYRQERNYYCEKDRLLPGISIREAEAEDCACIAAFAGELLPRHYQVFALRDKAYYERLLKEYKSDGGRLMIYEREGRILEVRPYVPAQEHEAPKIMVRIVDLKRMMMSLKLKSLAVVCFQVTDPAICENNCCIVMTGTEHSGVMLMEGKEANSEGILTIAALASLVFGAKSVDEVCKEQGVRMTERMKKEMKKIIPLSKIYLNEVV